MIWASLRGMIAQGIGLVLVAAVGLCEAAAADGQVPGAGAPASGTSARTSATDPTRVARAAMPRPAANGPGASTPGPSEAASPRPTRATVVPAAVLQVYRAA